MYLEVRSLGALSMQESVAATEGYVQQIAGKGREEGERVSRGKGARILPFNA